MPLTNRQGATGGRAAPDRKARQDPEWTAGAIDNDQAMLSRIVDELAILREENDDLRGRVWRLEARSGRGIMHPSEFSDGMSPRSA